MEDRTAPPPPPPAKTPNPQRPVPNPRHRRDLFLGNGGIHHGAGNAPADLRRKDEQNTIVICSVDRPRTMLVKADI